MRHAARPLEQVVDEVERARVRPVEVLEHQHHGRRRGEPLEERAPRGEQLLGRRCPARRPAAPAARARSSAAPPRRARAPRRSPRPSPGSSRSSSLSSEAAARRGPSRPAPRSVMPSPYAGRAALVPPDRLHEAVDVLQNSHARRLLPMPAGPDDRHEPGPPLAGGGVEQVLEQPQLVVAADERRLQRLRRGCGRRRSATTRSARHAGHRRRLALEHLLAGRLERDGRWPPPAGSPRPRARCPAAPPTGAAPRC